MKREKKTRFQTLLSVFITLTFSVSATIYAQQKPASIKIGTYDSRIVTFAWSRSEYFGERLKRIGNQTDSAQKVHDTARIKEISVDAIRNRFLSMNCRLNQKCSTGMQPLW